jgi:hypothetical protein
VRAQRYSNFEVLPAVQFEQRAPIQASPSAFARLAALAALPAERREGDGGTKRTIESRRHRSLRRGFALRGYPRASAAINHPAH